METVGNRIHQIMAAKNLSGRKFSEMVGIAQQNISSLKRSINVNSATLKRILDAFPDVSTDWLVLGVGSMFIEENKEHMQYLQERVSEKRYNLDTSTSFGGPIVNPRKVYCHECNTKIDFIKALKSQLNDKERLIQYLIKNSEEKEIINDNLKPK